MSGPLGGGENLTPLSEINEKLRRERLKEALRAELEQTLDQRVNRYLEVQHQNIIPGHHFAAASAECLALYRDGCFLSTVMASQAVAEGIFRFVLERNSLTPEGERPEMARRLVERHIVSERCAVAFIRIWKSFRNDVHHMNSKVAMVPFTILAKRNIDDLAIIEREIFAYCVNNGKLSPVQPRYWDVQPDGTVPVFLRLDP